ncbi:MAG: DNA starvation/stationary phase protection protein [Bacteroidota bacterium]|nr:DNA starvation/stationary phase protection protein [Odoribacter sp.]MDP3642394.1 DNA starvation/stationary phase protection protein [Bacteroidota bacterium]
MNQTTETSIENNKVVVTFLNLLLADEYVLYTKTRTAHWNLDGSNYFELHVFLENQYNVLDLMIDEIAEQIRSLGHYALGSLKDFLSIAQMNDDNQNFRNAGQVFETLLNDHQRIIHIIKHELSPISQVFSNRRTAIFLTEILEKHKKMAWMIRLFMSNPEINVKNRIRINNNQPAIYENPSLV